MSKLKERSLLELAKTGSISCTSGDGLPYVKVAFRTLEEAQAFHSELIETLRGERIDEWAEDYRRKGAK